jgi:hypothetical protein
MQVGMPESAVIALANRLSGCGARWVVGGSTGLAIRGARLASAPRDLDVYADEQDVPEIHELLSRWSTDAPEANETERYRSVLSHYEITKTTVELVGGFHVFTGDSVYKAEVRDYLCPEGDRVDIFGVSLRLVPLGHELIFNLMRAREDRVKLVAGLIRENPVRHTALLERLLKRNAIGEELVRKALSVCESAQGAES